MAKKDSRSGQQLLALALEEMNQGLPPGELLAPVAAEPQPAALAAQPETPTQDWAAALQRLNSFTPAPASTSPPPNDEDMFRRIQDQAEVEQDRLMGQMFGESPSPTGRDEPRVPPAVDRYLERILA